MIGEDDMGPVTDEQIRRINAFGLHAPDFFQDDAGVDDNAVTQDASFILIEDAAWQ